jgi:hypothetical protein
VKIAKVLGTDDLYAYLAKYHIELDPHLEALIDRHSKKPWTKFITAENTHLVSVSSGWAGKSHHASARSAGCLGPAERPARRASRAKVGDGTPCAEERGTRDKQRCKSRESQGISGGR